MPRFHFVVRETNHTYDDPEGEHFPNQDAARKYGHRIVRELRESGYDSGDGSLLIHDETGRIITSIPF